MRLEHLLDMEFRYAEPIDMIFPFNGREGQGYGGGDGTATGGRVRGSLKWSNWPRIRKDGTVQPDITGVIHTDDGAKIVFRSDGYSINDPERESRTVIGGTTFLTDDQRYSWINTVYALQEGAIDLATGVVQVRYYECIPDAWR
jgi:hypothetical protein